MVSSIKNKFPYKLIDLTHTLSEKTPSWDGGCGFNHDIKLDYDECNSAIKFRVCRFPIGFYK